MCFSHPFEISLLYSPNFRRQTNHDCSFRYSVSLTTNGIHVVGIFPPCGMCEDFILKKNSLNIFWLWTYVTFFQILSTSTTSDHQACLAAPSRQILDVTPSELLRRCLAAGYEKLRCVKTTGWVQPGNPASEIFSGQDRMSLLGTMEKTWLIAGTINNLQSNIYHVQYVYVCSGCSTIDRSSSLIRMGKDPNVQCIRKPAPFFVGWEDDFLDYSDHPRFTCETFLMVHLTPQ